MVVPVNKFLCQVEEKRASLGMTKKDVSLKCFNNVTTYYNILCDGRRNLNAVTMDRLAKTVGMKLVISLEEIYCYEKT